MNEDRNLKEVVEVYKIIRNCLRDIYEGDTYMCRVLSVQLRILLCDFSNKTPPLLNRFIGNLEIQSLESLQYDESNFSNSLGMPFELKRYWNGVEDSKPLFGNEILPINIWIDQFVLVYPVPITIRGMIRLFADKQGGAHVDKDLHPLIERLQGIVFGRLNLGEMIIVGLAKIVQQLIFQILNNEKNGQSNALYLLEPIQVPKKCYEGACEIRNLLMV